LICPSVAHSDSYCQILTMLINRVSRHQVTVFIMQDYTVLEKMYAGRTKHIRGPHTTRCLRTPELTFLPPCESRHAASSRVVEGTRSRDLQALCRGLRKCYRGGRFYFLKCLISVSLVRSEKERSCTWNFAAVQFIRGRCQSCAHRLEL
jgi:hypothetical protein